MTNPTHIPSRVYRGLENLALDLLKRADEKESYQVVFFRDKGEHKELMNLLIEHAVDGIYVSCVFSHKVAFRSGAIIIFHHIDGCRNKPVNTIGGLELTTAVFLNPQMHLQEDIMYTTSRLRSRSTHPSELWLSMIL